MNLQKLVRIAEKSKHEVPMSDSCLLGTKRKRERENISMEVNHLAKQTANGSEYL